MSATTIKVHIETKAQLDLFREYKNESYDEVLRKLLYIAKKAASDPKLSRETIRRIEKARERFADGDYLTEAQAKKRLGL